MGSHRQYIAVLVPDKKLDHFYPNKKITLKKQVSLLSGDGSPLTGDTVMRLGKRDLELKNESSRSNFKMAKVVTR